MRAVAPVLLLLLVLAPSGSLRAQDEPPPGLAAVELARSRACVGSLARLADLNRRLEPFANLMERMRALGRAVSLEDTTEAAPFSTTDSTEAAVARWFEADAALAQRYVAERDSTIQVERAAARDQVLDAIRGRMASVNEQAQAEMTDARQVETDAQPCEGAILVRSAVLEACAATAGPVCDDARSTEPQDRIRFVDAPEDLWNMEDHRPWTEPTPLQGAPDGSLVGARTAARARRGNIVLIVGVAPMIRQRSALTPEQIGEFEANLDSLGFTFEHPGFVMAPALEVQLNLPAPIAGETHYLLHFGDLSGPDVIWSLEAGGGGLVQATFPASAADLARLQAGEPVSLTAVSVPEGENPDAEPRYTLPLLQVNQAQSVGALVRYMASGQLGQDLAALVPPAGGTAPGER